MNKLLFVNGFCIGWSNGKDDAQARYPKATSIDEGAFIISVSTIKP